MRGPRTTGVQGEPKRVVRRVRGWSGDQERSLPGPGREDNPYTWRLAGQERTMGKYLKLILGRKGRNTWAGNTKEKQGLGLLLQYFPCQ